MQQQKKSLEKVIDDNKEREKKITGGLQPRYRYGNRYEEEYDDYYDYSYEDRRRGRRPSPSSLNPDLLDRDSVDINKYDTRDLEEFLKRYVENNKTDENIETMKEMITYKYDALIKKNKDYVDKEANIQILEPTITNQKKYKFKPYPFTPKMKIGDTIQTNKNLFEKEVAHLPMLLNLLYTLENEELVSREKFKKKPIINLLSKYLSEDFLYNIYPNRKENIKIIIQVLFFCDRESGKEFKLKQKYHDEKDEKFNSKIRTFYDENQDSLRMLDFNEEYIIVSYIINKSSLKESGSSTDPINREKYREFFTSM